MVTSCTFSPTCSTLYFSALVGRAWRIADGDMVKVTPLLSSMPVATPSAALPTAAVIRYQPAGTQTHPLVDSASSTAAWIAFVSSVRPTPVAPLSRTLTHQPAGPASWQPAITIRNNPIRRIHD